MNRRSFVKGAAVGLAGVTLVPRRVLGGQGFTSPSDELTKAIIGVGGMGQGHIDYDGARLLAICDVDEKRLGGAGKKFPGAKPFTDFRKMLDDKSVDVAAAVWSGDEPGTPSRTRVSPS